MSSQAVVASNEEYFRYLKAYPFPESNSIPSGPSRFGSSKEHPDEFITAEFNATTTKVAASKTDGSLLFYFLKSGEPVRSPPILVSHAHTKPVESISYNPISDTQLATVGIDCSVKVWDSFHGTLLKDVVVSPDERLNLVRWSISGKFILVSGKLSKKIYVLSAQEGFNIITEFQLDYTVNDMCWNNSDDFVFAGLGSGEIKVLKFGDKMLTSHAKIEGNSSSITALCFDKRGYYILSGAKDGTVAIWSLTDLSLVKIINDVDEPVVSLAMNKDGTYVGVAYQDSVSVKILDIRTCVEYHTVDQSFSGERSVPVFRFCPNKTTYLYSTPKGRLFITVKESNKNSSKRNAPNGRREDVSGNRRDGDRERERERDDRRRGEGKTGRGVERRGRDAREGRTKIDTFRERR